MKKLIGCWLIGLLSCHVQAELSETESLLAEMAFVQDNQTLLDAAMAEGKDRALLCGSCHGKDGNSTRDYIPNLASQNAAYLFKQFELFADGTRKDYVMEKLAKNLTRQDRVNIALYFSQMEVKPRPQPVAASISGEQVYKSLCFTCHGNEGQGNGMYPRIAGQPFEYLNKTLQGFKGANDDRKNSPMAIVIQNLNEQQLKDVSAFIAAMH